MGDCGSNRHQVLQKANNKVNASNEKQVLSPEVSEKFRQIVADMEDFANVDETDRSAPLGATGDLAPDRQSQSLYDQLKKEVTDRGMEVKETLKKFQGKVFHAVNTTHGIMLRYRIGLDGKITLEKDSKVSMSKLKNSMKPNKTLFKLA